MNREIPPLPGQKQTRIHGMTMWVIPHHFQQTILCSSPSQTETNFDIPLSTLHPTFSTNQIYPNKHPYVGCSIAEIAILETSADMHTNVLAVLEIITVKMIARPEWTFLGDNHMSSQLVMQTMSNLISNLG